MLCFHGGILYSSTEMLCFHTAMLYFCTEKLNFRTETLIFNAAALHIHARSSVSVWKYSISIPKNSALVFFYAHRAPICHVFAGG
ncbi:MAG: hypothetical protein WCR55_07950 [Lentisphaerota bacterium]